MRWSVPIQPDAPTGRQWARDELSQPIYQEHTDPVTWLIEKITEFFGRLGDSAAGGTVGLWVIAVIVVVIVAALIIVLGPMRRARSGTSALAALEDSTASAAELRAAARGAFDADDLSAAVIYADRALVQDAIERTVISPRPGLTAHEAADRIAPAFPELTGSIRAAADNFDRIAYANARADRTLAIDTMELARNVARARPRFSELDAAPLQSVIG